MKTKSLYIASLEHKSDSLVVCIGIMQKLKAKYGKVAFFRPIIDNHTQNDRKITTIKNYFNLDISYESSFAFKAYDANQLIKQNKKSHLIEEIIIKYKKLELNYDFILLDGCSLDINLELAKNLSTPLISVIDGYQQSINEINDKLKLHMQNINSTKIIHFSTVVINVDKNIINNIPFEKLTYYLPFQKYIYTPTIEQIKNELGCEYIFSNETNLQKTINDIKIAAMRVENFILNIKTNDLIITPKDRSDIIFALLTLYHSKDYPNISAIILTGDIKLKKSIKKILQSFDKLAIPILTTKDDTFTVASKIDKIEGKITYKEKTKISKILGLFTKYVDNKTFEEKLYENSKNIMTPMMFEYNLFKRATKEKAIIVLPESLDDRILKATEIALNLHIANIILLGDEKEIIDKSTQLGINISKATIINPKTSNLTMKFAKEFCIIRKEKAILEEDAIDMFKHDFTYFATMMVHLEFANGLVSGAINTTANTVRPAFQIIKTKPTSSVVSSIFLMSFDTQVLVYADCAINQDPTADELATIAIDSAKTSLNFGIEPKVAMLSYSTGDSGTGKDVQKIKEATQLVKQRAPNLAVEGPIQYDAAINKIIAKQKLPNSKVAGDATVFIFPDLNTGNNTYKAVRDASGAIAIGPILQGLNKPVNDLSRGCIVEDIVNTIAITSIQANEKK